MRILFVSSSSGSHGGGELYLLYLGAALKEKGVTVGFWISSDPQMDELASQLEKVGLVIRAKYTNTYLRTTRCFSHLIANPGDLTRHKEEWRSFKPDVIHLNKQCLEDGLDLLMVANEQPVPHCCTIHITQTAVELKARLGNVRDWLSARVLNNYSGQLVAISSSRAKNLGSFLHKSSDIKYVVNGVQIPEKNSVLAMGERMKNELFPGREKKCLIIVAVGRLEEQKNPLHFLKLMGDLKQSLSYIQAVWVGDGRMRAVFEDKIEEMGANDWIQCIGWQSDVSPYLSMADVYVHPARFEGLPFSLLEAMAHGKPCVIRPELADDLKDIPRDTWILSKDGDNSWTEKVTMESIRAKYGKLSLEVVLERFSLDVMAEKYIALYKNLMRK